MQFDGSVGELLDTFGGIATTRQLLELLSRRQLDTHVRNGRLERIWYGVYGAPRPSTLDRLRALDIFVGRHSVACLGTAAALYGFDTENTNAVHVFDPGIRLRPTVGLSVHQREGAPIRRISGRLASTPAWTAIEVARQLRRPRALATLDAALHSPWCTPADLAAVVDQQRGRRGIVAIRELLQFADGRSESAMESEARLVMIDRGIPMPELQHEIWGIDGELYRVDFAWPEAMVIAEYDSVQWHAGRAEMLRDKRRSAVLQELGWIVIPILVTDVRQYPDRLADRISSHLANSPSRRRIAL